MAVQGVGSRRFVPRGRDPDDLPQRDLWGTNLFEVPGVSVAASRVALCVVPLALKLLPGKIRNLKLAAKGV